MLNVQALKQFRENNYARHLVLRSENVEILVVCWQPGQGTPIHDHGKADGLMVILEGELTNTTYTHGGQKITTVWRPGDIGHTPVGDKHEVHNLSQKEAVSLHIYAPPLDRDLQSFDLGYHNRVIPQEIQLPGDVVRYLVGAAAGVECIPTDLDPGL